MVISMLISRIKRLYRQLLCSLLGIERWHSGGEDRHPYRNEILSRLSAHTPSALLDIGCGLGDIVCQVSSSRRLGCDMSQRVLSAARLSHPWQWMVHGVRFRKMCLGDPVQGRFDAVICVNFIHNIAPADLRMHLHALVQDNLAPNGLLVFDVIDNPQYRYNHDAKFLLQGLGLQVKVIGGFEFGRALVFAQSVVDPDFQTVD